MYYFINKKYHELTNELEQFRKSYQEMKDSGKYTTTHLTQLKNEFEAEFKVKLQAHYDICVAELEKRMEKIQADFLESKKTIEDPIAEFLKRQEWELELQVSDTRTLENHVAEFKESQTGDKVLLNMLRKELIGRGETDAATNVKAYMDAYHIGEEYKNDEHYKGAFEEIITIRQVQRSNLIYVKNGDELEAKVLSL